MGLFIGKIHRPAEDAPLEDVRTYLEARINRNWAYRLVLEVALALTLLAVAVLATNVQYQFGQVTSAMEQQTNLFAAQQKQIQKLLGTPALSPESIETNVQSTVDERMHSLAQALRQLADQVEQKQ